jgi:peptidyl-prolyl cis-trans isomerase C
MFAIALALFGTASLAEPAPSTQSAPSAEPTAPAPAPIETAAVPALPAVMVTVNGEAIAQRHADILKHQLMASGQPDSKALDKRVLDTLVNLEVLSQAAKREGLDKTQDMQDKIAMQYKDLLAKAYIDNYVATHPISDDMLAAEYARLRAELPEKEYKTRHMLVKSEAEAKKLIARLKKEKFETLAKANSKDEGSAKKGGDLGWVAPDAVVKPFADAMVALKKGETTAKPVQSDFGWHIIRVEDVRALDVPPLDAVKPQLRKELSQRMVARAVSDLRAQAKIE